MEEEPEKNGDKQRIKKDSEDTNDEDNDASSSDDDDGSKRRTAKTIGGRKGVGSDRDAAAPRPHRDGRRQGEGPALSRPQHLGARQLLVRHQGDPAQGRAHRRGGAGAAAAGAADATAVLSTFAIN